MLFNRRVVIGGFLAVVLLVGTLVFRGSVDHSRAYIAESLLVVSPFTNALLLPAFKREVMRSSPGIVRLGFELSTSADRTSKGITYQTNGVIWLLAAGATAADAERLANTASEGVRVALGQRYGVAATPLIQAHSAPSSALHEPFRLRFGGNATPGPFPTVGRVYFQKPEVSIDPGTGWMREYAVGREPVCDPGLTGIGKMNGAFIRAVCVGVGQFTNVPSATGHLHSQIDQEQELIESSYKEEPFATESGMQGAHISFTRQHVAPNPRSGGMTLMTPTTHYYVFTNAHSRAVVLMYLTVSGSESEEVQRMIRRTLRVD
jgi:hypothetical protein